MATASDALPCLQRDCMATAAQDQAAGMDALDIPFARKATLPPFPLCFSLGSEEDSQRERSVPRYGADREGPPYLEIRAQQAPSSLPRRFPDASMQAKWASEPSADGLPPKPRRRATAGSDHHATWRDLFLTTTQLSAKASGLSGALALRRSSFEAYLATEFAPASSGTTSLHPGAVGLGVPTFRRSAGEQERRPNRSQSPTVPFRRSSSRPRTSKLSSTARLTAVQSNTTPRVVHASKAPSLAQASEAPNPLPATLPSAPPPPAADATTPCVHTAVEVDPSLSTPLSSALIWRNSLRI